MWNSLLQTKTMETTPVFACSKVTPFGLLTSHHKHFSFRHFNKYLERKPSFKPFEHQKNLTFVNTHLNSSLSIASSFRTQSFSAKSTKNFPFSSTLCNESFSRAPLKCSVSNTTTTESDNPFKKGLRNLSFDSIKSGFFELTPFDICKWVFVFSISIAASKWTLNVLFNPFFWMYFSWVWLFWPWVVAIGLALYGFYCYKKHLRGEANVFEQLAVVTSTFTWLTLLPPAHFNGFLEGWPFVFFFVYHYFFFFNVSVRKRLYGDYYPREHDPKWDVSLPNWQKLLFCVGVMVAHWLAAFEGPELHLLPSGWINLGIWVLIMVTLFMQYHSTLYLAKYSEKVVVPTAVVQFGPYRFVRHPIYASTMLLFVTYFTALRAPLSALFVVVVCSLYYGLKAKVEESLMLETFGERYAEYMSKVRYKFIPFVY